MYFLFYYRIKREYSEEMKGKFEDCLVVIFKTFVLGINFLNHIMSLCSTKEYIVDD
jgi:hypothetical protein